jgi:hypothetical protein
MFFVWFAPGGVAILYADFFNSPVAVLDADYQTTNMARQRRFYRDKDR